MITDLEHLRRLSAASDLPDAGPTDGLEADVPLPLLLGDACHALALLEEETLPQAAKRRGYRAL